MAGKKVAEEMKLIKKYFSLDLLQIKNIYVVASLYKFDMGETNTPNNYIFKNICIYNLYF